MGFRRGGWAFFCGIDASHHDALVHCLLVEPETAMSNRTILLRRHSSAHDPRDYIRWDSDEADGHSSVGSMRPTMMLWCIVCWSNQRLPCPTGPFSCGGILPHMIRDTIFDGIPTRRMGILLWDRCVPP